MINYIIRYRVTETSSNKVFKYMTNLLVSANSLAEAEQIVIDGQVDTAAVVGGLAIGDIYQTSGAGASPLNVAGILMIKQ